LRRSKVGPILLYVIGFILFGLGVLHIGLYFSSIYGDITLLFIFVGPGEILLSIVLFWLGNKGKEKYAGNHLDNERAQLEYQKNSSTTKKIPHKRSLIASWIVSSFIGVASLAHLGVFLFSFPEEIHTVFLIIGIIELVIALISLFIGFIIKRKVSKNF